MTSRLQVTRHSGPSAGDRAQAKPPANEREPSEIAKIAPAMRDQNCQKLKSGLPPTQLRNIATRPVFIEENAQKVRNKSATTPQLRNIATEPEVIHGQPGPAAGKRIPLLTVLAPVATAENTVEEPDTITS